ncbi:MAG TPA: redoxin domain-containing protein, partial [Acidimicrobiia bacterium]
WGWSVDDDQYDFTITQQLNLALDVAQQSVSLQPVGGITISGLPTTYKNLAKPKIENARDAALGTAQSVVHDALMGITFTDQLKTFDPSAQAKYKALEIDPAGVILRGTLTVSSRPPVVVSVTETAGGTALTALKSWVPAGTVDDYIWSWVTPDPLHPFLPWSGVEHAVSTPHQFIFSRPGGWESATHQVCLQVQGTQTGSVSSGSTGVSGGTTCHVEKPEWLAVIPSWWIDVLMVPIWTPDPPPDAILDDAIVAHMNVRPESGVSPGAATASIVHFTGDEVGAPLPALGEALLRSRHRGSAIPVIVVVPSGLFQHTRSSLEERLGRSVEELAGPLAVTEDYQEHWSQAFQPGDEPATFLMSAQGEVVWREVGPVQAASLAAALDEHATAGLRRQSVLLQPGVQVGEPAPEVLLEDGHGQGPLLRGGSETGVRLVFWKSWSSPCLKELRYLQRLQDQSPGEGPVILAIGDGEDPRQVDEIARQHDLRFALVGDPDRRVARGFEINCWPTTIQIDETGLVRSVHLGMTPEHGRQEVARAAGHH